MCNIPSLSIKTSPSDAIGTSVSTVITTAVVRYQAYDPIELAPIRFHAPNFHTQTPCCKDLVTRIVTLASLYNSNQFTYF